MGEKINMQCSVDYNEISALEVRNGFLDQC